MARVEVFFILCCLGCLSYGKSTKLHDILRYKAKEPKTVCYVNLDCFSTDGTFKGIFKLLPESPESIGTSFTLFTKHNVDVGQDLCPDSPGSVELFEPNLETIVLIHGFAVTDDPRTWFLKYAFLNHTESQVIVVDWRKGSRKPEYWQAAANSELVGRQIAFLLKQLKAKRGLKPEKVHIVGGSLGAHAGGFAGKWTRDKFNFLVGRISGNDPAGPFFEDASDRVHLSSKDADFVDIIHTSGGKNFFNGEMGIEKPIGHVDFYPNGGVVQPACVKGDPICSHTRADELFASSLDSGNCLFKSYPCPSYEEFLRGNCNDCGTMGCSRMGFGAPKTTGKGKQFLQTDGEKPYCKD